LAATGIIGKPKVGYAVPALIDSIETYLGWKNVTDAFVIGAGHLGGALLGYDGFKAYGLNILSAFDTDPAKIGTTIYGKDVLPMDKLPDLVARMHVGIGILTVRAASAQEAANITVMAGIKAIWNFTQIKLQVAPSVIVENMDLSASLAVLSRKLAERDEISAWFGIGHSWVASRPPRLTNPTR
jgi:redox-sensing transcriptional repressor